VLEVESKDHEVFRAAMLGEDGAWIPLMTEQEGKEGGMT
jgi:hypothetical protein